MLWVGDLRLASYILLNIRKASSTHFTALYSYYWHKCLFLLDCCPESPTSFLHIKIIGPFFFTRLSIPWGLYSLKLLELINVILLARLQVPGGQELAFVYIPPALTINLCTKGSLHKWEIDLGLGCYSVWLPGFAKGHCNLSVIYNLLLIAMEAQKPQQRPKVTVV